VKRPQGFDRRPTGEQPTGPATGKAPKAAKAAKAAPAAPAALAALAAPAAEVAAKGPKTPTGRTTQQADPPVAERELKKAARARRRYERGEVRRFTRRSRRRRVAWLSAAITAVVLVGLVTVAVYSPLLALRTVTVVGTSRVDAAAVREAVGDQGGKPLALVDFARVKTELSRFPLIRSFVTETVPPDTLVIRVTERAPVASVAIASAGNDSAPCNTALDPQAELCAQARWQRRWLVEVKREADSEIRRRKPAWRELHRFEGGTRLSFIEPVRQGDPAHERIVVFDARPLTA